MVGRFRYCADGLFLVSCAAYLMNRLLIKPWAGPGLLSWHFNDVLLLPAALPPVLWLHRRLGLRTHDRPPSAWEICGHWVFWSWLFEWAGPRLYDRATADAVDILAYAVGGCLAWLWWHRARWQKGG